jgi:hypothetical protein
MARGWAAALLAAAVGLAVVIAAPRDAASASAPRPPYKDDAVVRRRHRLLSARTRIIGSGRRSLAPPLCTTSAAHAFTVMLRVEGVGRGCGRGRGRCIAHDPAGRWVAW